MLLRETNQSLFPVDPYRYRPDLIDPYRYNPGVWSRRQTMQGMQGMGSMGDLFSIGSSLFTSLFHEKSAAQTAFDNGRQPLMDEYVSILNTTNPQIASGTITYAQMSNAITAVKALMTSNDNLRATAIAAGVDPSWVEPRFEDFQRPFQSKVDAWNQILATLPKPGITEAVTQYLFGGATGVPDFGVPSVPAPVAPAGYHPPAATAAAAISPLLIGGVLLGLFLMGSKKHG